MTATSTENTILSKSRDLFLQYGVKSVSMDDIAKELSMSKKTLYQYFDGKSHLIHRITEKYLSEEIEEIKRIQSDSTDAIDEMHKIVSYVIRFISNLKPSFTYDLKKYYPQSWSIIEDGHMGFIEDTITLNIDRGKEEGLYREEIQTEIIAKIYVSNSMNILLMEFPKKDINPVNLYKEMILYHLHGIISEKGRELFKQHKSMIYASV